MHALFCGFILWGQASEAVAVLGGAQITDPVLRFMVRLLVVVGLVGLVAGLVIVVVVVIVVVEILPADGVARLLVVVEILPAGGLGVVVIVVVEILPAGGLGLVAERAAGAKIVVG